MTDANISPVRDPFVLLENGVYYMYATGWVCYKNTSGRLEGDWVKLPGPICRIPENALDNFWAPEVHRYKGKFYMFTTYRSSLTGHRGSTVLCSDSPEGPFTEISRGHLTPRDWDCIDSTFYVDPQGQPWMVFVHEWTSMPDGVGTFAAAKLSPDLTELISEPVELFRGDEPAWAKLGVTDGCFLYTTEKGELLILWSNFCAQGYCVAVARSSNGRPDGKWIHEEKLLYSKDSYGDYDGGHGMIFATPEGKKYLVLHAPNDNDRGRGETPRFIPIREEDGKLVTED